METIIENKQVATTYRNFTLARMAKVANDDFLSNLTRVDLPQSTLLLKPMQPIQWVYFLERGMASVTTTTEEGETVETGVIGREGPVGFNALLGHPQTHNRVMMQGAGHGFRIRASLLREHLIGNASFQQLIYDFLHVHMAQATQMIVCNRVHEVEARLARWLLMAAGLMETSNILLTQEFLAQMLGTRRSTVTVAAGTLQRSGMISYSRGKVEIVNRELLEGAACECYTVLRDICTRVYPELY